MHKLTREANDLSSGANGRGVCTLVAWANRRGLGLDGWWGDSDGSHFCCVCEKVTRLNGGLEVLRCVGEREVL